MEKGGSVRKPEWFEKDGDVWRCLLCPRGCRLDADSTSYGFCRVRGVKNGEPFLPGYGGCVSLSIDPIEKKPLYHFLPGSSILSTGPAGCNLSCDFCQNWSISQGKNVPVRSVSPVDLASMAMSSGSSGIAYTYTEPAIWYEYIYDSAPLVREKGGVSVMVSNGMVNPDPLRKLIGITDAWNIDLKSWSNEFYVKHCAGSLPTVLETLRIIADSECHLEVTFLVIPGENDDPAEWKQMADWLALECGDDTVLHISRYFPRYRLKKHPTPVETLTHAKEIFSEKLNFVYLGNVGLSNADIVCPSCSSLCVSRTGIEVTTDGVNEGACGACGRNLNLVNEIR